MKDTIAQLKRDGLRRGDAMEISIGTRQGEYRIRVRRGVQWYSVTLHHRTQWVGYRGFKNLAGAVLIVQETWQLLRPLTETWQ